MISALWIFVIHSRGNPNPLFKRALYTNANFVASLAFMMVMGASVVGLSSVLSKSLQKLGTLVLPTSHMSTGWLPSLTCFKGK